MSDRDLADEALRQRDADIPAGEYDLPCCNSVCEQRNAGQRQQKPAPNGGAHEYRPLSTTIINWMLPSRKLGPECGIPHMAVLFEPTPDDSGRFPGSRQEGLRRRQRRALYGLSSFHSHRVGYGSL